MLRFAAAVVLPPPSSNSTGLDTNAIAAELRDIKAPVSIPSHWGWIGWLVLALLLLLLAVWLWKKWRRKRAAEAPPPPVVPAHIKARHKLREALEIMHQPRPFCILVSDTVRVYLEERFEFHAPERTTEEFLDELQATALLTLDQKQVLGDFLNRCDLVKFAQYEPVETELRNLYESALRLIDETEPPTMGPGPVPVVDQRAPTSR